MWLSITILILMMVLLVIAIIVAGYRGRTEKPRDRDVLMAYYDDGLLELFFGLMIIFASVLMLANQSAFIGIIFALLYPFLLIAKQSITAPRLSGREMTSTQVSQRMQTMFIGLGLFLLLGVAAFFLANIAVLPRNIAHWLAQYRFDGLLLIIITALTYWGLHTSIKRLFAYAGLLVLFRISSIWVVLPLPFYLMVIGFTVFISGLLILGQFVLGHPKIDGMSRA